MAELSPAPGIVPRLELRGIRKHFGSTAALQGVDFAVPAGHVAALVGENGAGKSTLMNVLSGAVRPDAGTMSLDGAPFRPRDPLDARRHGVAMVRQELALAPHLSAEDNLFLGLEATRRGVIDRRATRARARSVLAALGHADISPETRVGLMPLATRQMLEIARALLHDARVVIFDEPTSALTHDDTRTLFRVIRHLRERGLSIVYISHVLEEVQELADSVTVIRDGRIVASDLLPNRPPAEIVQLMVGRAVGELYPRSKRTSGEVLLSVTGLGGAYRPIEASFELRRGEVLGIAGIAGAGRTELLRAIFGLDPVKRGQLRVGLSEGPATPMRRLGQGVGLLSEDRAGEGLALHLSIAENLTLSRLPFRHGWVSPSKMRDSARALIPRLGIRCRSESQPVGQLSGGNQQKVALGRLLHHDVDVLLLDEPTRGVDVGTKADLYALVDALVSVHGKAIVWVSSYLPELLGMADRIAVLRRGHLLPARPVAELTEHDVLLECVGGE